MRIPTFPRALHIVSKLTVRRYYSWMGPSSVRRDILNKYREEKKALGITKGGRRTKRGGRVARDSEFIK